MDYKYCDYDGRLIRYGNGGGEQWKDGKWVQAPSGWLMEGEQITEAEAMKRMKA